MLLTVFDNNPDDRKIRQAVEVLRSGGLLIYPTDTIYGVGCDIYNKKAIERLCVLKNIPLKKANFSFICKDLSHLSQFAKSISTPVFRVLNSNLPGPFTFILPASKEVPKLIMRNKTTVGIRVPDNKICRLLLEEFGQPIISTSLPEEDDLEELIEPELIYHKFEHQIDAMLDAGLGGIESSTVVDCTEGDFEILRQGKGELLV
jgi:tRNA threonylcarbamoyl adenosine modification protein (Sua5/YciO/YrdC/YwlC family)